MSDTLVKPLEYCGLKTLTFALGETSVLTDLVQSYFRLYIGLGVRLVTKTIS